VRAGPTAVLLDQVKKWLDLKPQENGAGGDARAAGVGTGRGENSRNKD